MLVKRVQSSVWTIYAVAEERDRCVHCQLLDFLVELEADKRGSAQKLIALLDHVSNAGPQDLSDDVSHYIHQAERIFQFRKGDIRAAWFYDENRIIVCTHGFLKNSRRTPKPEIRAAIAAKHAYFTAKESGTLQIVD